MSSRSKARIQIGQAKYGSGLFAARDFALHSRLGRIRGKLLLDTETFDERYAIGISAGMVLDPHVPFRFLNHSCEPCCALFYEEFQGRPGVAVYALRDIVVGEELTIDYGWSAKHAIPCGCGTTNCRGYIVSATDLKKVIRRERRP